MIMQHKFLLSATISLLAVQGHTASFDCSKASSWVEETICANSELSRLDDQLAEQYKATLNEYKSYGIASEVAKNEQLDWLTYQRNTCQTEDCLIREYKQKLGKNYYADWNIKADLLSPNKAYGTFSYPHTVSVYNGENKPDSIFEEEDKLTIYQIAQKPHLAIVDGNFSFTNAHMCTLEDEKATWVQNHWQITNTEFATSDLYGEDWQCELRLYPRGKHLFIRDVDNQCRELYCGARIFGWTKITK